jgi:1-deoxy-D-xylulose-5-phosphate synthase
MLASITGPADLRGLDHDQLTELAGEIRRFLIDAVAARGGHLGPNLGVVELTIALHRAFDSPADRIVWDTGHQAYVHKLLTGRQDEFGSLRTMGGLSGYPSRDESPHDVIENSHASVALGHAIGLAEARRAGHGEGKVVAVVGDGSLTGGVALEALNLAGHTKPDLLLVLNDNGRSYAPTVGGLQGHLGPLRLHPAYERLKSGIEGTLGRSPVLGDEMVEAAKRVKEGAKALVAPRTVFEDLGWQYAGPIDGHDLPALEKALDHAKRVPGPVLLHVITAKGRGYRPAEEHDEDNFHSLGAFDPATGMTLPKAGGGVPFTSVFAAALVEEARLHPELVAISAAMVAPTGLKLLQDTMPGRVHDVGIAEQVGVTMAAGMAAGGLRPVVAVYSTFLQRAFDQVMMDVCLHRHPVTFVLDRSGVTGEDGPSHHGVFDVTYLRCLPGLTVASPRDGIELRRALATALEHDGPFAIRFPKATTAPVGPHDEVEPLQIGEWEVRREGGSVLLLGLGQLQSACEEAADLLAAEGIGVTLVDPRFVKPIDPRLPALASAHKLVVTVEDNVLAGGFGSGVTEVLADAQVTVPVERLGIPDRFLPHGKRDAVLAELGLDGVGIAERVSKAVHALG